MATQGGTQEHIAASIGEWKDYYMVRRNKSILAIELPQKISENVQVSPYPLELSVYLFFEDCFMKVLKGKVLWFISTILPRHFLN